MSDSNAQTEKYHGTIPLWNKLSYDAREKIFSAIRYTFIGAFLFVIVAPMAWMMVSSFRTTTSVVTSDPAIFSTAFTFEHYINLIEVTRFVTYFSNTLIVAAGVVTFGTTLATLGGYGLSRLELKYGKLFARMILFGYMFPGIILGIPMFIVFREVGLVNSLLGLVIAESAVILPFALWLMWQFFQSIPQSLEESARMAGASRFQAFKEVVLPQAKPGIVAVSIFVLSTTWNQFTIPRILLTDLDKYVITVALDNFQGQTRVLWTEIMAMSTIAVIPALIFMYLMQDYLLKGFESVGT